MLTSEHASCENIALNGGVEDGEEFVYLRAIVDREGRASKDIKNRPQKAGSAFHRSQKRRTKIPLFNTKMRTVQRYIYET